MYRVLTYTIEVSRNWSEISIKTFELLWMVLKLICLLLHFLPRLELRSKCWSPISILFACCGIQIQNSLSLSPWWVARDWWTLIGKEARVICAVLVIEKSTLDGQTSWWTNSFLMGKHSSFREPCPCLGHQNLYSSPYNCICYELPDQWTCSHWWIAQCMRYFWVVPWWFA